MIEGIIGAVVAIVVAVFGFLFHRRGDRIKELERSNDAKDRQIAIDKVNRELSRPLEGMDEGKDTQDLIDDWNSDLSDRV